MNTDAGAGTAECYSDQILLNYHSGSVNDLKLIEEISSHVAFCTSCESRLRRLEGKSREPAGGDSQASSRVAGQALPDSTLSRLHTSEALATTRRGADPSETLPAKIDRYFIIRELGTGGFGRVYLAKDPDRNCLVALKIPRQDRLISRQSRDAFLKEARTVAQLDHPNITPLYDYRELEDGRYFVVMKFIEGASLREIMKSERISPRRSARLIAMVADALHYAHQHGIWHRDVKPANILIDKSGTPYLTDFGLAIHEDQQYLHQNELAGTYPYMSPEQISGESAQLDGRSDIWSLGVVFYELLARKRPFQGTSGSQLKDEITRRPHRPLHYCDSEVPHKLARICDRCLKKNVEERYATASHLAADLRSYLSSPWKTTLGLGAAAVFLTLLGYALAPDQERPNANANSHAQEREAFIRSEQKPKAQPATAASPPDASSVEMKLVPIAWATLQNNDFYRVLDPRGRVVVKSSSDLACFQTHQPPSGHFRMHISADLENQYAQAGIVFGIHQTSPEPKEFRCQVAYVLRGVVNPGMLLIIEDCRIRLDNFRHFAFRERKELARAKLDEDLDDGIRLEMEVDSEQIVSLKYNGESLHEVPQKLNKVNIPHASGCGIVALGHVVFHTIECKELTP